MHIRIDGRLKPGDGPTGPDLAVFCGEAVKLTGLHLISGPFHFEHLNSVQAFAILAESHVSVEAIRNPRAYFVDVFTCAPFDIEAVINLVRGVLGEISSMDTSDRGDNLAQISGERCVGCDGYHGPGFYEGCQK